MEQVVAGVGVFDIKPTHDICVKCPYLELETDVESYYFDGVYVRSIKPHCMHIDICKRAYEKGEQSANLSCPTVKE